MECALFPLVAYMGASIGAWLPKVQRTYSYCRLLRVLVERFAVEFMAFC